MDGLDNPGRMDGLDNPGRETSTAVQAILMAALLVLVGCAGGTDGSDSASNAPATTGSADDLLPVDCLLPGQIRQLGQFSTYVTRGQSVKTSAVGCRIRGGEYVAYDRANYATALKVWLPKAQEGDAEAQTYVGQIYEKGLGVAPDYTLAGAWYQKAAAQNYSPAQIDLGLLYEQGLGVAKDPQKALDLYRSASGLQAGDVQLASLNSTTASDPAQVTELQQALGEERAQSQQLRERNERLEQELAQSRSTLAAREQQAARERQGVGAAQDDVNRQQAALQAEQRKVQGQSEQLRRLQGDRDRLIAERDQLARDLQVRQAQAPAAQPIPQADLDRLKAAQQRAAAAEADAQRLSEQAAQDQAKLERSRSELAARDAELQKKRQEIAQLDDDIVSLKQQTTALRDEAATLKKASAAQKQPTDKPVTVASGPIIQMLDPVVLATRGPAIVSTKAGVERRPIVGRVTAPAGLASLVINDASIQPNDEGVFQSDVAIVPGGSDVVVVAVDRRGGRSDVRFRLAPEGTAVASRDPTGALQPVRTDDPISGVDFGSYYALVIGNNEYGNFPKLKTAVDDAQAVSAVLANKFGFKVTTLLNATRYQILSELNKARERLTESDNFMIYYAGHGEIDKVNQRGNWLPVDAEPESTANWIPNTQITDILNALNAKHVLVVVDSCYSGSLTRSALARLQAGLSADARANWIKAMVKERSRTALTSGGDQPVIDTVGGQHSIFAQAFLDALSAQDRVIDGQRLAQQVSTKVSAKARDLDVDQVPQYAPIKYAGHGGGEFFFVTKNGAPQPS